MDARILNLSRKGIIFDEADIELVLMYPYWEVLKDKKGRIRAVYTTVAGAALYLHRHLMKPSQSDVVDHIDGNPLNNCRLNLRVTSQANNTLNRAPSKGKLYKGVSLRPNGMYRARLTVDGICYQLCEFTTELEAARAYDTKARVLHGKYARLNCG